MLEALREVVTRLEGAEGACASGQAAVDPTTEACAERFPAASKATTPNVYDVPQAKPVWLDEVELTVATFVPARYTS